MQPASLVADEAISALCEKTALLSHLCIKTIILPRQARDKHRENSKKDAAFRAPSSSSQSPWQIWQSEPTSIKGSFLECFPYVCPGACLGKMIICTVYLNMGKKRPFSYLSRSLIARALGTRARADTLRRGENGLVLSFPCVLSRACLGKTIVFWIESGAKRTSLPWLRASSMRLAGRHHGSSSPIERQ